jgi:hypothetical protein
VAIKFLYADLPEITIERARRETEIRISSENLVEMIDFIDVVDDGVHHYHVVSELLEGVLLSELLKGNLSSQDGEVHADEISYASDTDKKQVGIEIHSGKNRIVRRIFESLGYRVCKLDRVMFAGLTKKGLKRGDWRYLTEQEVAMLHMGSFE